MNVKTQIQDSKTLAPLLDGQDIELNKTKKVIIGMSGGVDSSVSALILLKQGYQVEGLFMKNWDEDDGTEYCTAMDDLADAQAVADRIGIKLHKANFAAEYWDNVFEHFLEEYKAGRTPNPDILCNREIKFKAFLEYAMELGADYIATGHYSKTLIKETSSNEKQTFLVRGDDRNKDQTYFLHAVSDDEFAKTLFPVGHIEKPLVRKIAEEFDLATAKKKDSTGICFIGERRFKDFLQQYLPAQPGKIETPEGEVIGEHQGLMYYTLGQRQGLGIGGTSNHGDDPWYVGNKDLDRNVLIAVQGDTHPLLYSKSLTSNQIFWVSKKDPEFPLNCVAKVRYRQGDQACTVNKNEDGQYFVEFVEPQRAVTPGQSVVFYMDEICLGGGVIETINRIDEAQAYLN